MYKCQLCQQVIPANVKSQRVVVEARVRHYPFRAKANRAIWRKHKWEYPDDNGGVGREIVREVIACQVCAANHHQTHPG